MNILELAGTIAAIWGAASILTAVAWSVLRRAGWRGPR